MCFAPAVVITPGAVSFRLGRERSAGAKRAAGSFLLLKEYKVDGKH